MTGDPAASEIQPVMRLAVRLGREIDSGADPCFLDTSKHLSNVYMRFVVYKWRPYIYETTDGKFSEQLTEYCKS